MKEPNMLIDHDTILQDWKKHAEKDEESNFRFLRSLKMVPNPDRIDALASELHADAFGRIDCTRCANCCKTMRPGVSAEDIERIAEHLGMSCEAFTAAYLEANQDKGGLPDQGGPVPVLGLGRSLHDLRDQAEGLQRISPHGQGRLHLEDLPALGEHPALPCRLLYREADAETAARVRRALASVASPMI
jgi:hypothetical protein